MLDQAKDQHGIPRCFYCRRRATVEDHYIPLALGGSEDDGNMVAACPRCNARKGDKHPTEFLAELEAESR